MSNTQKLPISTSSKIAESSSNECIIEKVYRLKETLGNLEHQIDCIQGGLTGKLANEDCAVPNADGVIPVLDYCLELAQDLKYKAGSIRETVSGS